MAEIPEHESAADDEQPVSDGLPEDLPPVEPPSAGFIVQLFLVPALIVMVIVGVWALFGMLASSDQDVFRLLSDIESENPHRRGPAMHKLAQILRADTQLPPQRQQYVQNSQVATATAQTLEHWIKKLPGKLSAKKEVLNTQSFMVRALGWFDVPEVVSPPLRQALHIPLEPSSDDPERQEVRELQLEVRKSSLTAIANIAGRALERGRSVQMPELIEDLIEITGNPDEEPVIRQFGTFSLGLFRSERATEQLRALLVNADDKTRLNAAIALARQDSTAGYGEFKQALSNALKPIEADGATAEEKRRSAAAEKFERSIALKNTLKAIDNLNDRLTSSQRTELAGLIGPIAEGFGEVKIRIDAQQVMRNLRGRGN